MLAAAPRRILWVGGGVISSGASAELVQLAETLEAPVFTSANGRGAIAEDHPLCMGPLIFTRTMKPLLDEAQVVLAVGTRFQGGASGVNWRLRIPCPLIHLDVDPRMIDLNYPAALGVVGDARLGLEGIRKSLGDVEGDAGFLTRAAAARAEVRQRIRSQIGPEFAAIMDAMREQLPRDAVMVRDTTVPAYQWGNRILPILAPATSLMPTSSAIGPGFPLALGAALGSGKPTLLITGDGGFMLHIGELATAAQYGIPVVICVFNNGGYGVLRDYQAAKWGRTFGVDLATPDFAAAAQAMGVAGERVGSAAAFPRAFQRAVESSGPALLDIDMSALK